jgi:hypothetical protein
MKKSNISSQILAWIANPKLASSVPHWIAPWCDLCWDFRIDWRKFEGSLRKARGEN